MKKTNRILLGLGTLASAIVPIATVVACNNGDKVKSLSKTGDFFPIRAEVKKLIDAVDKTKTKEEAKTHVDTLTLTKDQKASLKKYIDDQEDYETAWHLMNFLQASTDIDAKIWGLALLGLDKTNSPIVKEQMLKISNDPDNFDLSKTPEAFRENSVIKGMQSLGDKLTYYVFYLIISSGDSSIEGIVGGIIEKFDGKNPNFDTATVTTAAKYDPKTKTLAKGTAWKTASDPMGGNATVEFLLKKQGYTLA